MQKLVFFSLLLFAFRFWLSDQLFSSRLFFASQFQIQYSKLYEKKKVIVDLAIKCNHSNCRSLYWEASDQKMSLSRVRFGVFSQSPLSYHTWKKKFTSNIHMLSKFSHCSTSKCNMHTYWCHVEGVIYADFNIQWYFFQTQVKIGNSSINTEKNIEIWK